MNERVIPMGALEPYTKRQFQLERQYRDEIDRCPNLRDYYPDEDAYQLAYERWQANREAIHAKREALALALQRERSSFEAGLLTDEEFRFSVEELAR